MLTCSRSLRVINLLNFLHCEVIPYTRVFTSSSADEPGPSSSPDTPPPRHLFLHASAIKLSTHSVTLDRTFPEHGFSSPEVPFEYLVYALGSHLPRPIDLWSSEHGEESENDSHGPLAKERMHRSKTTDVASIRRKEKIKYGGTKREGIALLKRFQSRVAQAQNILIVGGGPLGVRKLSFPCHIMRFERSRCTEYATDIATVYPSKNVTLLHSRDRLLPRFNPAMHTEGECK